MSTTTTTKPKATPVSTFASPPEIEVELGESETEFPPSPELGDQLSRMMNEQAEINRKKAEELACVRELQSHD